MGEMGSILPGRRMWNEEDCSVSGCGPMTNCPMLLSPCLYSCDRLWMTNLHPGVGTWPTASCSRHHASISMINSDCKPKINPLPRSSCSCWVFWHSHSLCFPYRCRRKGMQWPKKKQWGGAQIPFPSSCTFYILWTGAPIALTTERWIVF